MEIDARLFYGCSARLRFRVGQVISQITDHLIKIRPIDRDTVGHISMLPGFVQGLQKKQPLPLCRQDGAARLQLRLGRR